MKPQFSVLTGVLCLFIFMNGHSQTCGTLTASPDDTICTGQSASLTATYTGPVGTTQYSTTSLPYSPYTFTGGQPVLINMDDAWSSVVQLPFCFEFYGTVYNQIIIGTNGLVSFDVSGANGNCPWTINVAAPNPGLPMNAIMAPFHDIDPTIPVPSGNTVINYQVVGSTPCRKFVVSWNDIAMYGPGCSSITSKSQVVLHETTYIIDIFIANKAVCTTWNNGAAIEGLQNATGTAATVAPGRNYPSQWSALNDGMRFKPAGAPPAVQWFDPSNTVIGSTYQISVLPTQTTTYTVEVTYTSCNGQPIVLSDQVTIYVIQSTLTVASSITNASCNGLCDGSVAIFPSNGQPPYSFQWFPSVLPPVSSQSGLCPGNYSCTIIDGSGCPIVLPIIIGAPPAYSLTVSATNTQCNTATGSATVTIVGGNGPFTYSWSTGDTTQSVSNLAAGIYQVVVSDSSGCPDSMTVNVLPTGLNISTQTTSLLCNGDCNATATAIPTNGVAPYTFQWSPYGGTASTATSLCAGAFTCMVVDAQNCSTAVNINIAQPPPIVVSPASNLTICNGDTVTISVVVAGGTPPYSYAWNNNLPPLQTNVITPSQTTWYTVDVTDANGCTAPQQSTQVKVHPDPVANFYSTEPQCPPVSVQFTNATDTAISYTWYFGDPLSGSNDTSSGVNPNHIYWNSGTYNVTLVALNQWGCSDTITHSTGVIPSIPSAQVAALAQIVTTEDPTSTFFNNTSGGIYYCISYGDGDTLCTNDEGPYMHTYDTIGTYLVMLVAWNNLGCSDTAWTILIVEEPTTCYIPNTFTPNGDGTNETFMVYGINFREFELMIFDRWGMMLFTTNDVYHGWDGTYRGNKCQEDTYVWRLKYSDNLGGMHERMGHVNLIR